MTRLWDSQNARLRDMLLAAILFISVTTAQLNTSQILSQLPKCALNCVISGIGSSSCPLTDLTCICQDEPLQSTLSICVQSNCTFAEQLTVASLNQDMCAGTVVADRRKEVEIPGIAFVIITVPIVALRCYSRYKVAKRLWWDDYMIVISTVLLVAILGIDIVNGQKGFGKHLWDVDPRESVPLIKLFVIAEVLYIANLTATKISILFFYLRVFQLRWFRNAVWVTMFMVAAWGVAFSLVIVFQCHPISGAWDRTVPSKCLPLNAIAYSSAAISIAQDILILGLPVTQLLGLQMNLRKKLNVLAMFGIGAIATVTSIVRLKFIVSFGDTKDPTWDNVLPSVWSLIEINVAMICACLPSLRALLSRWLPNMFDITHKTAGTSDDTMKSKSKWNNERIISNRGKHSSSNGFGHIIDSDGEDGYELSNKEKVENSTVDVESTQSSNKALNLDINDIDAPRPFTGERSPATIDFGRGGSEEDLVITNVTRMSIEDAIRRGHAVR